MTAVKSNMGTLLMNRQKTFFFSARKVPRSEPATITVDGDAKARLDKLQAELAVQLDQAAAKLVATGGAEATETLGQQTIEGIIADGTRTTETIEAGAIGNDRPIHVVDERWFSSDLQTAVMTKHSDRAAAKKSSASPTCSAASPRPTCLWCRRTTKTYPTAASPEG